MSVQKSKAGIAFMTIICLVVWFALALQLYLMIDATPGNGLTPLSAIGRFLIFFTVLSNLLIAISLSFQLTSPRSAAGIFFSKSSTNTAIALYIIIVGLVYNTILRGLVAQAGLSKLADELLHVVVPLLFLLFWIFFVPKGTLKWTLIFPWAIYPAAYLVYVLLRGKAEGFYAYPFINVVKLGYQKVAVNSGAVLLVFLAAGLLLIAADRKIGAKAKT